MEKSLSQESPRTVTTMALITPAWATTMVSPSSLSMDWKAGPHPVPDVHEALPSGGAVPREIPAPRLEALGVHGRHLLKGAHLPIAAVYLPQLRHLTHRQGVPSGKEDVQGLTGPRHAAVDGSGERYAPEGRGQGFGLRPPSGREGEIRLPEKPRFFVGQLGPAVTDKIECGHSLHPLR